MQAEDFVEPAAVGGEDFAVRFDDGFRGPPPPELVKKLEKLNEAARDQLIQKIGEIRERGTVNSEDRQKIFTRMVDDALQGQR